MARRRDIPVGRRAAGRRAAGRRAAILALGFVAIAFTLGVGLVVGELVVRTAFADVTTTPDNSSFFAQRWKHTVRTNSLGFREREVAPAASDGVYRIAVIGDSFTWGQGVDVADRLTERLAELLDDSPGRVEVLNFGRPGAETDDHIRILSDIVLPLGPDFVLLQWFVNDVEADKSARPATRRFRLVPSDRIGGLLHRRSALYYLADSHWRKLQSRLGLVESYGDYMDRRFGDPASPHMVAASAALREFISMAREAGVEVGIVAFPFIEMVDSIDDFALGYLIDRVLDVCAAEDIGCVDMREPLVGLTEPGDWWASRFDTHPGPLAHEAAAVAVERRFGARWRADAAARSGNEPGENP